MFPDESTLPDIITSNLPRSGNQPGPSAAERQQEVEPRQPMSQQEVGSPCARCNRNILLFVETTSQGRRGLQLLLLTGHLRILCIHCATDRGLLQDFIQRRNNGR